MDNINYSNFLDFYLNDWLGSGSVPEDIKYSPLDPCYSPDDVLCAFDAYLLSDVFKCKTDEDYVNAYEILGSYLGIDIQVDSTGAFIEDEYGDKISQNLYYNKLAEKFSSNIMAYATPSDYEYIGNGYSKLDTYTNNYDFPIYATESDIYEYMISCLNGKNPHNFYDDYTNYDFEYSVRYKDGKAYSKNFNFKELSGHDFKVIDTSGDYVTLYSDTFYTNEGGHYVKIKKSQVFNRYENGYLNSYSIQNKGKFDWDKLYYYGDKEYEKFSYSELTENYLWWLKRNRGEAYELYPSSEQQYYSDKKFYSDLISSELSSYYGLDTSLFGVKGIDSCDQELNSTKLVSSTDGFMYKNYSYAFPGDFSADDIFSITDMVDYAAKDNNCSFENLGFVLSTRNDTTVDELKLMFSGNIKDILYDSETKKYTIVFLNNQNYEFTEEDYNGFIKTMEFNESSANSLEDSIYNSNANICCAVEKIFSDYFLGSNVDVRKVSSDKYYVIIDGVEYFYDESQILDIAGNFVNKDSSEVFLSKIDSYLKDRNGDLVINPSTGKYCFFNGDKYTEISLKDFDLEKIQSKYPDIAGVDNISIDMLLSLIFSDLNITNEETKDIPIVEEKKAKQNSKYISSSIFKPIISIDESNLYLNYASFLNDFDLSSISSSLFSSRSELSYNGLASGNISPAISKVKGLRNMVVTLAKQIEYSVSLVINFDERLVADLDAMLEEFFVISNVSYEGENKIDLTVYNDSAVEFFTNKKTEFYRKANELTLALEGNVVLTREQYDELMRMGYGSFLKATSERQITGKITDSNVASYYYISLDDCAKILRSNYQCSDEELDTHIINNLEKLNVYNDNSGFDIYNFSNLSVLDNLSIGYVGGLGLLSNEELLENEMARQRNYYSYANLSEFFPDIFSDNYIKCLNSLRLNGGINTYSYDDSLNLGMNALKMHLSNYGFFDIDLAAGNNEAYLRNFLLANKLCSSEFLSNASYYDVLSLYNEKIDYFTNDKTKYNRFKDLVYSSHSSASILPYNYQKMKGYELALKYLEGIYSDAELSVDEIASYILEQYSQGFISPFSNICDLVNPEKDSKDYMKDFLTEMMMTTSLDEKTIESNYVNGEMSSAEYNLKKIIIDQANNGEMGLFGLNLAGGLANVAGAVKMERFLSYLTASVAISAGINASGKTLARLLTIAKMVKDGVMVASSGGSKKKSIVEKYGDLYYCFSEIKRDEILKEATSYSNSYMGAAFLIRNLSNITTLFRGKGIKLKAGPLEFNGDKVSLSGGKYIKYDVSKPMIARDKFIDDEYQKLVKSLIGDASEIDLTDDLINLKCQEIIARADSLSSTVYSCYGSLAFETAFVNNVIASSGLRAATFADFYASYYTYGGSLIDHVDLDKFNKELSYDDLWKAFLRGFGPDIS